MSLAKPMDRDLASPADGRISLPEILSALSFALDLTEGAVHGHAVRSCLLGMRMAHEAQIDSAELSDLYYALLLKDIGCSSNAARMCQIFGGDDRAVKGAVKLTDWTKPGTPTLATLRMLWGNVLPHANPLRRIAHIVKMGASEENNIKTMITLRCDRGAQIMRKLDMGDRAAEAVRCLDEHWDGSGFPDGLTGESIPRLARILAIAQHLDVFSTDRSPHIAIEVMHERSGRWFDPELVQVADSLHRRGALWSQCLASEDTRDTQRAAVDLEPGTHVYLGAQRIDRICEAFADVVDAKSPYTFRHSLGVTDAAVGIAQRLGLISTRVDFVRRAALLHDLGKLSIPNTILDKPTKLDPAEWEVMRDHPVQTRRILERVSAFRELAVVAGEHHEKLDGSGYPNGLTADSLSLESRIVAVADVYAALSEDRPYRAGLDLEQIVGIMKSDLPHKLDRDCFDALIESIMAAPAPRAAAQEPVCA